jgi:hypothetical protein
LWWQFTRPTIDLYDAIHGKDRVLAACRHTKFLTHALVSVGPVFDVALNVFAFTVGHPILAVLECTLYESWVRQFGSSLETRLRYTLEDCFETYPFPFRPVDASTSLSSLASVGEQYHLLRQSVMHSRQEGLTKTYNRFHDPDETADDIQRLRDLHVEMDKAVAAAYGWDDLVLAHGFHETKQGIRFTISEAARREVLQRLLKLNHDRYDAEVREGKHDKKKGATKKPKAEKAPAKPKPSKNLSFGFDTEGDDE